MAFNHNCKECPMKFQSETDLQTHLIAHSDPITDYGSEKEPAMAEFLRSFFPNINASDILPLNPNSIPSLPDTTEPSYSDNNKTYTTLKNMHVPGMVVPNLEDLIKIFPQPKKIRFLNPVRFAKECMNPVIRPVYIERPHRSVALFQNTYGDDRCSRGAVLRPEVLSRTTPTITRVQRLDPSQSERKIEKLRNAIQVQTPKDPSTPPTNPNISVLQSTPRIPGVGSKPAFPCKVCTETFPTLTTMLNHNRTHSFGNLYSCFLCNRRFAFPYQLNNHLLAHTREDHPQEGNRRLGCSGGKRRGRLGYSCTVCKRSFGRINYLNLHKRCHERKEQVGSATEPSPERNLEPMDAIPTN